MVEGYALTAVVGASGSGKSSLVLAGLLPLLHAQVHPAATWDDVVVLPGDRPFHRFAASLLRASRGVGVSPTDFAVEAERLGDALNAGSAGVVTVLESALDSADKFLVVVDQFEELFTRTPLDVARRFVDGLLRIVDDGRFGVLIGLRSDHYGLIIDHYPELGSRLTAGQLNVGPMLAADLRQSIEEPALRAGLSLQEGLVERMLEDVEGQPGSLPLLEFALSELWRRREGLSLTHAAYDALGRVEGAVAAKAEEQFGRLSATLQDSAQRLLLRLVHVDAQDQSRASRDLVALDELPPDERTVVAAFVTARLLMSTAHEPSGVPVVEVAHEALISEWPRLRALVNRHHEFLLWRQRLRFAAREWERTGRSHEAVLQGQRLEEARAWLATRGADLTPTEREFISWTTSDAYQIEQVMRDASRLVPDVHSRGRWLRTLAVGGIADKALETVQGIRVIEQRIRALASIVEGLAAAGEIEAARDIARSAAAMASGVPAAESFVHDRAVVGAVSALCAAGLTQEALELTLHARDHDEFQVHCLIIVATALADNGQRDDAERWYESALGRARRIENDYARSETLVPAIGTLTRLGRHEEAMALAVSLEVGFNRSWALARAAIGISDAGRFDEAIRVADGLSDGFSRETALVDIAEESRRAGQPDRIDHIAGLLANPERRATVLASAAAAHHRLGNEVVAIAHLEALMRTIPAGADVHVLASLAERLVDGGLTEAARHLASAAERLTETMANYSNEKNYALASCVDVFARLGDLSHARELAERCHDSDQRLEAYASILSAWLAQTRPELRDALRPR